MGDSQSAELFGKLFKHFAEAGDVAGARRFYLEARGYDFSTGEMDCDGALIQLGLARLNAPVADSDEDTARVEYWLDDYKDEPEPPTKTRKCPECDGGRYFDPSHGSSRRCQNCDGTGVITQ